MTLRRTRFVIIGAGTAGLAACAHLERRGVSDFLLIDRGPLGTTCARVGCMPSKALSEMARHRSYCNRLQDLGIHDHTPEPDMKMLMHQVRGMRDFFVSHVIEGMEKYRDRFIEGEAEFVAPLRLRVGEQDIEAKGIILATGSHPVIPESLEPFRDKIITSDSLFEREDLPRRIGLIGVGYLGIELGLALGTLGIEVHAYDKKGRVAAIYDDDVHTCAVHHLEQVLNLHLGDEPKVRRQGEELLVSCKDGEWAVDALLVAAGRRPNIASLKLKRGGFNCNEHGMPAADGQTLQLGEQPVYLIGDANHIRPIVHEAVDEAVHAVNCLLDGPHPIERRVYLLIAFTEPDIARIGRTPAELETEGIAYVTGKVSFARQGKAQVMHLAHGCLRLYAEATTGQILGAEFIAPHGQHFATLLALAMQEKLTVHDLLRLPFYHPTLEEGLRTALRDAQKQLH